MSALRPFILWTLSAGLLILSFVYTTRMSFRLPAFDPHNGSFVFMSWLRQVHCSSFLRSFAGLTCYNPTTCFTNCKMKTLKWSNDILFCQGCTMRYSCEHCEARRIRYFYMHIASIFCCSCFIVFSLSCILVPY